MTEPLVEGTASRLTMERGWIVAVAVIAILVGVFALLLPITVTLFTVAILFGIYLIISGVFRLVLAFSTDRYPGRVRWLVGILGALILVAGIFCLSDPWQSLTLLGIVIGVGWIFDGIASIVIGRVGTGDTPQWLSIAAGIVAIVAGVLVAIMPVLALASFILIAAILLILVGISTLLLIPRKRTTPQPEPEVAT